MTAEIDPILAAGSKAAAYDASKGFLGKWNESASVEQAAALINIIVQGPTWPRLAALDALRSVFQWKVEGHTENVVLAGQSYGWHGAVLHLLEEREEALRRALQEESSNEDIQEHLGDFLNKVELFR